MRQDLHGSPTKARKLVTIQRKSGFRFENTHEAIIDADTWKRVQELRKNKRRPTRTGKTNMFSGIVRCADCGEKLYYCTNKNFEAKARPFCLLYQGQGEKRLFHSFIRAVVLNRAYLLMRLISIPPPSHFNTKNNSENRGCSTASRRKKELEAAATDASRNAE